MQLDQCLSCSRYEPIIGQTYDILNELGANLSNIQDDIQAGYMNMRDYLDFTDIKKQHRQKDQVYLDPGSVNVRHGDEHDLKDEWGTGVKMNWNLVPVENQRPHVNWRSDINTDDGGRNKINSYQHKNGGSSGLKSTCSLSAGNYKEWMLKHYQAMLNPQSAGDTGLYSNVVRNCYDYMGLDYTTKQDPREGSRVNAALENMRSYGYESTLQEICSQNGMDPVLCMAIATVESTGTPDAGTTTGNCSGMMQAQGSPAGDTAGQIQRGVETFMGKVGMVDGGNNPLAPVQAYNSWYEEFEFGDPDTQLYNEDWVRVVNHPDGYPEVRTMYFGNVCLAYIGIMNSQTGLSQLSAGNTGESLEFPIAQGDLKNTYVTGDYGTSSDSENTVSVSNVMTFRVPAGTKVYAPRDCLIRASGSTVTLKSQEDTLTVIYEGVAAKDLKGQESMVRRSGEIGVIADSGQLKIKVLEGDQVMDPKIYWPALNGTDLTGQKPIG